MTLTADERRKAAGILRRGEPNPLPRPTLGARIQAVPCLGVETGPVCGTVSFIHETHLWYEVAFEKGYRQCYQWGCTQ